MIEINGKEYPLRYSLGALTKFEKRAKVNVFGLSDPSKLSAEACAWLIYVGIEAGCKFEDQELDMTINDVMDAVDLSHVQIAFEALGAGEKKM
jgi:hypothetical protein